MAKETLNLEVKSNIKSVTKETDDLTTSLGKSVDETKDLGGNLKDAGEKGAGGFRKMGTAVKGMGMALKAAGIGLVVALIAKLMDVFSKNQAVMDFFNTAMESLSIAFNDLFSFLSDNVGNVTGWFKSIFEDPKQSLIDFGDAIKKNLIERFNSFLDTLGFLGDALSKLLKGDFDGAMASAKEAGKEMIDVYTGVNDSFDKGTKFIKKTAAAIVDYTKKTVKAAGAMVKLNNAAIIAIAVNQGIIEQKDREAELQRQIRDSEKATFEERIAANKKLGEILDEQEIAMMKNASLIVAAAAAQKNKNASIENQASLQEALNEKDAIAAQIAGLRSEQLVNEEGLQKELLETKREIHLASLEGTELELQELAYAYELKLDMARKAGEDTLGIEAKYLEEKQAIIDAAENVARDNLKAAELVKLDTSKKIRDANISNIEGGIGLVKQMAGENVGIMKAALIAENAVGIAKNIINTNAANARLTLEGGIAAPGLIAANFMRMGIGIISSVAATAAGLSALGGGGGGPGPGPGPAATAAPPAPQMMSGAFELTGGVKPEPTQAYVVSDDITDSQNGLAIIRRRSTI